MSIHASLEIALVWTAVHAFASVVRIIIGPYWPTVEGWPRTCDKFRRRSDLPLFWFSKDKWTITC
jgi:hypothetical protein